MKISAKKYAVALLEMIIEAGEEKRGEIINSFASDLLRNNETHKLEKIIREFSLLWDKKHSIINAGITSACDLGLESEKALLDYIKKKTGAKEINMQKTVDESIIGGVIIRYGDKIFDASLKTQLSKLKENLLRS